MATKVLTDPQHYTNIANAIREKNGTSNTYTPADMADAILAIESGGSGSLDHTVTFKDSDGNIVAIYSVIDGIGNISVPSGITATKWVDMDGNIIKFPVNPTSDMVIIAEISSEPMVFTKEDSTLVNDRMIYMMESKKPGEIGGIQYYTSSGVFYRYIDLTAYIGRSLSITIKGGNRQRIILAPYAGSSEAFNALYIAVNGENTITEPIDVEETFMGSNNGIPITSDYPILALYLCNDGSDPDFEVTIS